MRLTDFCHPIELRVPVPRAFPTRYRDFRRVGTPRSLWLHAVLPGEGEFHASLIRFGGSLQTQPLAERSSRVGLVYSVDSCRPHASVGVVFPPCLENRSSL